LYRFERDGVRTERSLGSFPKCSYKEAREAAELLNAQALIDGRSPIKTIDRRRAEMQPKIETVAPTFRELTERFIQEKKKPAWKTRKSEVNFRYRVETYLYPTLADIPVDQITTKHVADALRDSWVDKHESARRSGQIFSSVIKWGNDLDLCAIRNPLDRGVLKNVMPEFYGEVRHQSALHWKDLPALWKHIDSDSRAQVALRFFILTAQRSFDVRSAKWEDIDLDRGCWTALIHKLSHKNSEYRLPVPLPHSLVVDLRKLKATQAGASVFVFGGNGSSFGISDTAVMKQLRRWGFDGDNGQPTLHGLRSTFANWSKNANVDWELREFQLSHVGKDKVKLAYWRDPAFELRREIMDRYESYVINGSPDDDDHQKPSKRQSHLRAIA
tara:strand:+ start:1315 stop:2472 length:1158 start_codon:yes stop_codon:yes gene_type:complete